MPDIIVHDGPAPQSPQSVSRAALPQVISGLAAGQYRVGNLVWSPEVTVYDPVEQLPEAAETADQQIIVNNVAPDAGVFSFAIADNPTYSGPQEPVDPAQFALGPVARVAPSVSVEGGGAAAVGSTLIATRGLYMSLSQPVTVQREWLANGAATGNSDLEFQIPTANETVAYAFREIATDAAGSVSRTSELVTVEYEPPAVVGSFEPTDMRTVQTASSVSSFSLSSVNFGEPHADRVIEIEMGGRLGTGGATEITGVTIGGVAATPVSAQSAKFTHATSLDVFAAIWSAPVPAGTSGTVVISFGTSTPPAFIAQVWRKVGLVSDAPAFVSDGVGAGGTVSASVNAAEGDRCVFGIASRRGRGPGVPMFEPSANLDVIVDQSALAGGSAAGEFFLGKLADGATGAQTLSATSLSTGSSNIVRWTRKVRAS